MPNDKVDVIDTEDLVRDHTDLVRVARTIQ